MAHHNDVHGEPIIFEMVKAAGFEFQVSGRYAHLDDLIEFVGPYTSQVGDVPYISFTQYGLKEEGASVYPNDENRCWTSGEAMWRFRKALLEYLADRPSRQLAWRSKPRLEQSPDGDYVVRCRFALLGEVRKTVAVAA